MITRLLFLMIAVVATGSYPVAQEVLRVEKEGRLKTWHFYEGDEIYLKSTFSPDDWAKVTILDIRPDKDQVQFDRTVLGVDEILELKPISRVKSGNTFRRVFTTFGAALAVFSLADPLYGKEYRWDALVLAGGSVALGLGLNAIIDSPFRFDKKHRIRLLDLSPPPSGHR